MSSLVRRATIGSPQLQGRQENAVGARSQVYPFELKGLALNMLFKPKNENPMATCSTCGTTYVDDSDWSGDAHPERDCVKAKTERDLRRVFTEREAALRFKLAEARGQLIACRAQVDDETREDVDRVLKSTTDDGFEWPNRAHDGPCHPVVRCNFCEQMVEGAEAIAAHKC